MTQRRIGWISTALAFFVVLTSSLFQAVSVSAASLPQWGGGTATPIK
jgi:hypothetical protein